MTDIICISTTDWNEIWGSRQQLMGRLTQAGHRVLFVERQVGPEHLSRDSDLRCRKLAAWHQPKLFRQSKRLWLLQPPIVPPGRYYSLALNQLGQRLLAQRVRMVLEHLGFNRPILWLYPPHSAPLIGQFDESLSVYHCIERFAGGQSGRKRQVILQQEAELLSQADLVFTHAEGLRRLYEGMTRRPILTVPSAADVQHFQSTQEIDPELENIPTPRLGVMGTLDGRIDVKMLVSLVKKQSNWHLVLIGQVRPGRVNLSSLLAFDNVHFLGPWPYARLPIFLNSMDVLLIPYILNELTYYISPIKLYEYLAVGKPIASTNLPEVRPFSEWVQIAETSTDFEQAVQAALNERDANREAMRRQAAQGHTWDARMGRMWAAVEAVIHERG